MLRQDSDVLVVMSSENSATSFEGDGVVEKCLYTVRQISVA
jgi:hypothetical protein